MFIANNLLDDRINTLDDALRKDFLWNLWREQLEYAIKENTPAIKQIMKEHGLQLSDFNQPEDLLKFPIITKQKFREIGDTNSMVKAMREHYDLNQQSQQNDHITL